MSPDLRRFLMPKKKSDLPARETESLEALLRARNQMAVLCVLVERMNDALQRADIDDATTELGVDVGPAAVRLASAVRTDVWIVDSIGSQR
jgi:hypothetical protein